MQVIVRLSFYFVSISERKYHVIQEEGNVMINFVNTFMSYLVLLVIIVVVAGIATTIGITMAKKKNAGTASISENGDRT